MDEKGFTLVELLVSAFIFSIVVITVVSVFTAAIKLQNNVLTAKRVVGETNYALEFMGRNLRMAVKDKTGACIAQNTNYAYRPESNSSGIIFRNGLQNGECQEIYLENNQIKFKKGDSMPADLTSPGIQINVLKFVVAGDSLGDNKQPLVTIYLEAKSGQTPPLKIETSVSQRNLDAN